MARELKTREDARRMREDEFVNALHSAVEDVQVFLCCSSVLSPPCSHHSTLTRLLHVVDGPQLTIDSRCGRLKRPDGETCTFSKRAVPKSPRPTRRSLSPPSIRVEIFSLVIFSLNIS